jgi:rod shape-determining protein MreC
VKLGDLVVTSGAEGVYPRDVPAGRVSKVMQQTYGLYQEVEVSPVVEFGSLEDVLVILAPPPPAVAPTPARRTPARGLLP